MIKALANSLGVFTEDPGELRTLVSDLYKIFYTTEGVSDMDQVLNHVPKSYTTDERDPMCSIHER